MTQTLTDVVGPHEESEPVPVAPPQERIEGRTPLELAWRRIRRDKVALVSAVFIVFLVLVAVFAPLICKLIGQDPLTQDRGKYGLTLDGVPVGPSSHHWLGTDEVGRDVLARIIYGARVSLEVGLLATALSVLLGLVIGTLAGYYGGRTDTFLSRSMDVILSFPFVLTALSIVAVTGPKLTVTIAVISLFTFSSVGRIIRGQVLSLREREFVEAARSLGAGDVRIMVVDIFPNLVAPLLVYSTLLIPVNIVSEATLSFLGLGVPIPTATWGEMLSNSANGLYQVAWWYLAFPSLALLFTTLAFNLLGDGLRDALDPRADRVLARK
jgi:peptide/nickel transport system permease protein